MARWVAGIGLKNSLFIILSMKHFKEYNFWIYILFKAERVKA
jgi:hypothetical protein